MNEEDQKTRLKREFEQTLGYWDEACDLVLETSPAYFEAWLHHTSVGWRHGPLPPKVKEFIHIAVNASATHQHEPALRLHIVNALRLGANSAEIAEIFQVVSILGVHSLMLSVPILLEEAAANGIGIDVSQLSVQQVMLRDRFLQDRGYWPASWDTILALMPTLFEAHEQLGAVPRNNGHLPAKIRELLLIAVDASITHLWASGVRTHIRAAFQHGASLEEIVEVLELTSVIGTQSVTFGLPVLQQEALNQRASI